MCDKVQQGGNKVALLQWYFSRILYSLSWLYMTVVQWVRYCDNGKNSDALVIFYVEVM